MAREKMPGETPTIFDVGIDLLKPHPLNKEIYLEDEKEDKNLEELIKAEGIKTPLFITDDDVILDGHRRYRIAKKLGFKSVPCIIEYPKSREEEFYLILLHNHYRIKKPREIYNEYQLWKKILKPLAEQRRKWKKRVPELRANLPQVLPQGGRVTEQIAKVKGVSRKQLEKIDYIYSHEHKSKDTEKIVEELDKSKISVHRAYERMKEKEEAFVKTARSCDWCRMKIKRAEFHYIVVHKDCYEKIWEYLKEKRMEEFEEPWIPEE